MSKIITVSGTIAAGKSTFINVYSNYLRDTYGVPVKTHLEFVDNNELLSLMYEDPERWTYTSQVRFLVDKVKNIRDALETSEGIVFIERDYKELKIFIEAQRLSNSVTPLEYESYMELYTLCEKLLPENLLNFHLDVPYEVCMHRMKERSRSCELLGDPLYYKVLYDLYEENYRNHPEELKIRDSLDIDVYRELDRFTFKGVYAI